MGGRVSVVATTDVLVRSTTTTTGGGKMDAKRIIIGTIVGAVVLYVLGYLIFNVLIESFYAANMTSVPGVFHESQVQWAIILGEAAAAALLTLAILSRGGTPSLAGGAVAGAVVGFLVWVTADFVYYGLASIWTLTIVIVDPFVEAVRHGITGAVIALVLAKVPKSAG
jgi:hypothetical protein